MSFKKWFDKVYLKLDRNSMEYSVFDLGNAFRAGKREGRKEANKE
jgi:hypothetical protein